MGWNEQDRGVDWTPTYSIVKLGSGLLANLLSLVLGVGLANGWNLALDLGRRAVSVAWDC